jgi:hypothetical protein
VFPASSTTSVPTTETPPRRELRGVVERITFQNSDNCFTVARLSRVRQLGLLLDLALRGKSITQSVAEQ